jgi:hypothetical protein
MVLPLGIVDYDSGCVRGIGSSAEMIAGLGSYNHARYSKPIAEGNESPLAHSPFETHGGASQQIIHAFRLPISIVVGVDASDKFISILADPEPLELVHQLFELSL